MRVCASSGPNGSSMRITWRLIDQSAHDITTLAHAARQLVRERRLQSHGAQRAQASDQPFFAFPFWSNAGRAQSGTVMFSRNVRHGKEIVLLGDVTNPAIDARDSMGLPSRTDPSDGNGQARDDVKEGGFAAAAWTDERHEFTIGYRQICRFQRIDHAVTSLKAFPTPPLILVGLRLTRVEAFT